MQRTGLCCGNSNPAVCIQFILTLHPQAQGIVFNICSGAMPSGSMFYQVACGPSAAVGQPLCLNGPGPHIITFCKPGNNTNAYCITSIPAPGAGPNIAVNDGCTGTITSSGFAPGTVQWSSVAPGAPGSYNNYLSCPTCASTQVTAQAGYPAFVDYQVCGSAVSPCTGIQYCDTVRVYFNSTLTAAIVPTLPTVCYGASGTTITAGGGGGTPPYHYLWNTGATTSSIFVGPGTYTVSVGDTSQCPPTTATVVVTQFMQPIQANAGGDLLVCGGDLPVQLNASVTGAAGGQWIGGSGQFAPSNTALTGTYMPTPAELAAGSMQLVLATTGNGTCPGDLDTLVITFSNAFTNMNITGTNVLCATEATGYAAVVPADPSFDYLWNDALGQTTAQAAGLGAGTYAVQVTDAAGCDTTLSVTITGPPPLVTGPMIVTNASCAGSSNGGASVNISGGTPPYTVQWGANAGNQITTAAMNLGAGTYFVNITDANGCAIQDTAVVQAPPPVVLSAQIPDTVCVNAPVVMSAQASGGVGGYVYTWSGIGTGSPITHAFSSAQTVTVNVVDANGCAGPPVGQSVVVLDLSTATLQAWNDTTVCPGGSAVVGATLSGYPALVSYAWTPFGWSGPGPFVVPVTATQTVQVTATNACGQNLTDAVVLTLETPPQIVLPPLFAEGCDPLTVHFPDTLVSVPVTYHWTFGDGASSSQRAPVHTFTTGTWQVGLSVTTPAGCTASAGAPGSVIVHPAPNASFTAAPWTTDIDHPIVDLTDQSSGTIINSFWDFADGTYGTGTEVSHTFSDLGTYMVQLTVENIHGCTDSIALPVLITPVYDITVPNAFSPSSVPGGAWIPGDLHNDVFYPFVRFVKDFRMRIYNRWGELVFESNDLKIGWDGYYRGQLSQQDVYVYQIWVRFVDAREVERLGDVTLFR